MARLSYYSVPGANLAYSVDESPSDRNFVLHMHDICELLCVVSGDVDYLVEGHVYHLRAGSLMLMRRAETHRLLVRGKGRYERYTIHFQPERLREWGLDEILIAPFSERELGERNLYLPEEFLGAEPAALFRQACAACAALPARSALPPSLGALLCAVYPVFRRGTNACAEQETYGDDVGRELIAYINAHLTEELSLASLSAQVHMSPSQVNRVFHRVTGTSVYHYILSKRLILAQSLIVSGESAVGACEKCGFRDYSAFYRLYKKRMGTAPTALRRDAEQWKQ